MCTAETAIFLDFLDSVLQSGRFAVHRPRKGKHEAAASALIAAQLDHHRGGTPIFLVPAAAAGLVQTAYGWGARNCELHFV